MAIWACATFHFAYGWSQNTYAVVIGVSKYKEVHTLQYANKDALSFTKYLILDAQVPADQIKVFTNEEATRFNIVDALYNISKQLKPQDRFYFYFTGHGDIEAKIGQENTLLLLYNSYKTSYLKGTDYLQLFEIKNWLEGFSRRGVEVVFIADACHSGGLVGGAEGQTKTSMALKEDWSGINKFLSCQANEFSLEGRQWGQGRGLFSYCLTKGLEGTADANKDQKITLGELATFLSASVSKQAKPLQQTPLVVGNRNLILAKLSKTNTKNISINFSNPGSSAMVNLKGPQEPKPGELDRSLVNYYDQFLLALRERRLIMPHDDCAEYYYNKLMASAISPQVKQILTSKFAPALEEASTQVMRPVTDYGRSGFTGNWGDNSTASDELKLCIKILGPEHPQYNNLIIKSKMMDLIFEKSTNSTPGRLSQIKNELLQLRQQYPNLPYLSSLLIGYFLTPSKIDSAEYFANQVLTLLPNASYIYVRLGKIYQIRKDTTKAFEFYHKALSMDSLQAEYYLPFFAYHMGRKNYDEGIKWGEKALALAFMDHIEGAWESESSKMIQIYSLMGTMLNAYHRIKASAKFEDLLLRFDRYALVDTSHIWAAHQLVQALRFDTSQTMRKRVYEHARNLLEESKIFFIKKDGPNANLSGWYATYGAIARYYKNYALAEKLYLDEIRSGDDHTWTKPVYRYQTHEIGGFLNGWVDPYLELCILKIETKQPQEALQWLEKSIILGCKRKDLYQNKYLVGPLLEMPEYKIIMEKHFPDKK